VRTVRAAAIAAALCVVVAGCGSAGRGSGTAPSGQVAATSTDVSFVVEGTTTYGTLKVPSHRAGQHLPPRCC